MADQMGAIMLAYGIMGALIARERQGEGQKVEISHLGSMMHLQALNIQSTLTMGRPLPQLPRTHAGNPLWNHYRCQDDKWICLGMIEPHRYWHDFCSALGIAHLEHDPRFFHTAARSRNREEFIGILDERFAARTRDEWMQLLDREGDFIYTVMNDFPDVVEDPHAILNSYVTEYEHPKHGTIKVSGFPVTFSGSPCAVQSHAPGPGEHSREILSNLARFTPEEIDAMSNDNVIKSPAAKSVEEERHGHR
jgi:crotonobetainyl-CoA:carnitine CoA-transferase CaiB-like acyl-CoA transferase